MTKKDALRAAFLRGEKITPLIALERYKLLCLSQRVGNFRREGLPIKDQFVAGQPYKIYWLEQQQPEQRSLEIAA